LVERVKEIETDLQPDEISAAAETMPLAAPEEGHAKAILAYLNQRGYQMASFERLRRRIDESLTDQQFNDIIARNPTVFRQARLAGGKPGIAKLVP